MVKQWVVFRDTADDQRLRQLLRAESFVTGASMSAIVRDALADRYRQEDADAAVADGRLLEASLDGASTGVPAAQ